MATLREAYLGVMSSQAVSSVLTMLVPAWFLRESVGKMERILYGYSMGRHIWFIIQQVRNVWAQLVHESLRLLT